MAAEESPSDLYKRGNECFVSEDYERALDLYTRALAQDPAILEVYAAKAQAFLKLDKFAQAKEIADKGITVMREDSSDRAGEERGKCLQRSGVASFNLGKYREASNTFSEALKLRPQDKGLSQWVTWCEEKITKFGEDASKPSDSQGKSEAAAAASQAVADLKVSQPAEQQSSNEMPVPKIKHDWYQTETHVIVEVRIKKLKPEEVKVEFMPTSLSVAAKLATGSEYTLELDLAHPVVPDQSSYKVLSTKLEIRIRKAEGVRWAALEGDGSAPVPGGAPPPAAAAGGAKTPYASGRDWNRIEKSLAAEAEEKKEGEAALNEMFQKIYADANDDVRKAMNKSFSESGGTVLSTNWNEIGKDKVEVKPPDGMEYKKWD